MKIVSFPTPDPIAAAACTPDWIQVRRDLIAQCGFLIRSGPAATIEIKSATPQEHLAAHDHLKMNPWVALILPGGARQFVSNGDRDLVLSQLIMPGVAGQLAERHA